MSIDISTRISSQISCEVLGKAVMCVTIRPMTRLARGRQGSDLPTEAARHGVQSMPRPHRPRPDRLMPQFRVYQA
jgi:hypothetical protein